jgi:hypothetical protein
MKRRHSHLGASIKAIAIPNFDRCCDTSSARRGSSREGDFPSKSGREKKLNREINAVLADARLKAP